MENEIQQKIKKAEAEFRAKFDKDSAGVVMEMDRRYATAIAIQQRQMETLQRQIDMINPNMVVLRMLEVLVAKVDELEGKLGKKD